MVRKYSWYDPVLVKRMRLVLTILIWIVWVLIAYLQQDSLQAIVNNLFRH
ncbi:MAG: hypothetical protein J0H92_18020 [Sphingobacteriales bacterium]|jgi:uncharacterized membrane protein YhdT|nr:hypothetical protein [Sphingobacteriales bacterium]NCT74323.1 hypothetical protein [Chitinophagaceae bacterium]